MTSKCKDPQHFTKESYLNKVDVCVVTYKVSVQDVVASANRNSDDWGIEGYQFIKFNPFILPKNPGFKIVKSRQRDIMGEFIKHLKNVPGPSQYETGGNFLPK